MSTPIGEQPASGGGVTIQINSVAALERLLGGDDVLAVELRRSVAAEFARRHLETIAKTAVNAELAGAEEKVRNIVNDLLTSRKRSPLGISRLDLTSEAKALIKAETERLVLDQIAAARAEIAKAIETETARSCAAVPRLVDQRFAKTFDAEVNAAIT